MCHVSLGRVGGSHPHVTHDVTHDTLPCSKDKERHVSREFGPSRRQQTPRDT